MLHTGLFSFNMGAHNHLTSPLLHLMKTFSSPKTPDDKMNATASRFYSRSDNTLHSFFLVNYSLTVQKTPAFLQTLGS